MVHSHYESRAKALSLQSVALGEMIVNYYDELIEALESVDSEKLKKLSEKNGEVQALSDGLEDSIFEAIREISRPEGSSAESIKRIMAFLKISSKFFKAYEIARKFSKRIVPMLDEKFTHLKIYSDLLELAKSSLGTLRLAQMVLQDQGNLDIETTLSRAVAEESRSDDFFSLIHKDIIISNYREEVFIKTAIEVFNAGRRLERAADLALDIVKLAYYIQKGETKE